MPDLHKILSKTIREHGGRMTHSDRGGKEYRFPDGFRLYIDNRESQAAAANSLNILHTRYGTTNGAHGLKDRPRKPRMDLHNLVASVHAQERLKLMQQQAGVTFEEVKLCLLAPERVRWSERHGSWVWVRDRLAIPCHEARGKFVISTILWSTQDLFEENPRPEKAMVR